MKRRERHIWTKEPVDKDLPVDISFAGKTAILLVAVHGMVFEAIATASKRIGPSLDISLIHDIISKINSLPTCEQLH
jgi:hypothetical protein